MKTAEITPSRFVHTPSATPQKSYSQNGVKVINRFSVTVVQTEVVAEEAFVRSVEELAFAVPVERVIIEKARAKNGKPVERLDLAYLKSFANGDTEFEHEMLLSALEDIDESFERLQRAVTSGDSIQVKNRAHSLKSLSTIIGARTLYEQFREMENTVTIHTPPEQLSKQLRSIEKTWSAMRQQLENILAQEV